MTADQAIRALDRQLALHGVEVLLRRPSGTQRIPVEVACRAFVRGDVGKALVPGGAEQGETMVSLSPTEIDAAQWPGGQIPTNLDERIPRKGDQMVISGRTRAVERTAPIYLCGALVRLDVTVRG